MEEKHSRLLRLADILENVPPERFGLLTWSRETPCGFAGCAVGWATQDPEFQAEGLVMGAVATWGLSTPVSVPVFGQTAGWDAVQGFFGIGHGTALTLFDLTSYPEEDGRPTPAQVAARIRGVVRSLS